MRPPSRPAISKPKWVILTILAVLANPGWAATRYVSTTGNNSHPGTISQPWRTIQKAANSALPGDLVYIRGGTYAEAVSMGVSGNTTSGFITFQSYPGETAIIDGSTLTPPANNISALIRISDKSRLIFRDLVLRNYNNLLANDATIAGIYMNGTTHHVEVYNCKVHDIIGLLPANGVTNGIGVYGTNSTTAITDIIIDGCEIYNLKTLSSESVVFNGNVDGFRISNCSVHDCNNIGIDCIGFEGTAALAVDQARNGVVSNNHVYNIDSLTNTAYGGFRAAVGIYVDGGKDIVMERNLIHHCNIGLEVASEALGRVASNCLVRNNFIYLNHVGGIFLGGASDAENGGATNSQFYHNTLFNNDTDSQGGAQVAIQHYVSNITFKHNLVYAGSFGSPPAFVIDQFAGATGASGLVFDYNLYWLAGGGPASDSQWYWDGNFIYTGFNTWKATSGQDTNSLFVDPQLVTVNGTTPNLHLQGSSPARNAGQTTFTPAVSELEIDGLKRVAESRVDIGADEFVPNVTVTAVDTAAAEWQANVGSFTVSRTAGNTASAALVVNLANTGTATGGIDYGALTIATIPAGSTSTTVVLIPVVDALVEGTETAIMGTAVASGDYVGSGSATISIADRPLQQWRLTHFGVNASNALIAGDQADPDGDGAPNLLEYAIGTSPLVKNTNPFTISATGSYLTGTLTRTTANPVDVTLTGQVSSTLNSWAGAPSIVVLTDTATSYTFRDATLRSANSKSFLRIAVTP